MTLFKKTKNTIIDSPWHEGEQHFQSILGIAEQMADIGHRALRSFMPDQHRDFYNQLPFIVAGVVDEEGYPWATILSNHIGFIQTPTSTILNIKTLPDQSDPALAGFAKAKGIGFLGIELSTRRRNRINGAIREINSNSFSVDVIHTLGNCPKYIHLKSHQFTRDPNEKIHIEKTQSSTLTPYDIQTITSADSFYVASYKEEADIHQVDASHRGGKPGFIKVSSDGELTIPDFAGNNIFNTFGNIHLNGKAGLIFLDDRSGDVLQMTGNASVILNSPEADTFTGADRLWTFKPTKIVRRTNALPIRWSLNEISPFAIEKGSWEEVKEAAKTSTWHPLQISKIVDESSTIRSFYLKTINGTPLASFKAGQHLPIRVKLDHSDELATRTYTLSSAPSDTTTYRISVKKDGLVSNYLHNTLDPGDIIEAKAPQGGFFVEPLEPRPIVMLAAGVGITPMISMTREIIACAKKTDAIRNIWLFQASSFHSERAFDKEFETLMSTPQIQMHRVIASSDTEIPSQGKAQNAKSLFHKGRIDITLLKSILPLDDFDFYLCGPPLFMQAMYDALQSISIRDDRILAESFGPSALKRAKASNTPTQLSAPAKSAVNLSFVASSKETLWTHKRKSLLETAEDEGLSPAFSCRTGDCGSCSTKIIDGEVSYLTEPSFNVKSGEALICCAVPAHSMTEETKGKLILEL